MHDILAADFDFKRQDNIRRLYSRLGVRLSGFLLFVLPLQLHAQLRPLEPIEWNALQSSARIEWSVRAGWFGEQRASLAGATGDLIELGELAALVKVGGVMLEFAGKPQRFFSVDARFAEPAGEARAPSPGQRVHDSGDYRAGTIVPLTSERSRTLGVLRFGARLPTTDNLVGLDRDQTDFYASLGAARGLGALALSAELGLGIHGTRLAHYEQSDVLLYNARADLRRGTVLLSALVVGHNDLAGRQIRGNEDLGEARIGFRVGRERWVDAMVIAGYERFSPKVGVLIGAGLATGTR